MAKKMFRRHWIQCTPICCHPTEAGAPTKYSFGMPSVAGLSEPSNRWSHRVFKRAKNWQREASATATQTKNDLRR